MTIRLFDKKIAEFDAEFERWLLKNPTGKFSTFSVSVLRDNLIKGRSHATLGRNLKNGNDWKADGVSNTQLIYDLGDITSQTKICDYGCGSLRVGVHVMERQASGNYFGIDPSDYLIAEGIELVGPELIQQKNPVIGTIEDKLLDVIHAAVDVTFSFNVASHIHPDEQDSYIENLKAICHKPGARLLLNVTTHSEPVRFQTSGWAWTIEHYVRWLAPMTLTNTVYYGSTGKDGILIDGNRLTFQRC